MNTAHSIPGRTFINSAGEKWLYFAGTAYLGMPHYDAYQRAIQMGIEKYGANYGSSRASPPEVLLFGKMEEKLAHTIGAPAAILVSSGTLAGQLAVRYFESLHDCYFAPDAHPAITAREPSNEEQPFLDWLIQTVKNINSKEAQSAIFCNAVDSLGVHQYDFSVLREIKYPERVTLVVDDSHALGITHQGRGSYQYLKQTFPNLQILITASTGKAWGLPAGLLLGETALISRLRYQAFFRGASPPIPAFLYAFDEVFPSLLDRWDRLINNIDYFHRELDPYSTIQKIPHYPVTVILIPELDELANKKNILISAFPYPAPHSPKINRVVINALHTQQDLHQLIQLIKENL